MVIDFWWKDENCMVHIDTSLIVGWRYQGVEVGSGNVPSTLTIFSTGGGHVTIIDSSLAYRMYMDIMKLKVK